MNSAGLYVHFPFCVRKCRYCAFYSVPDRRLAGRYLRCLIREIGQRADPGLACGTVYFGGGTPSLLGPDGAAEILGALREAFAIGPGAEVTVEANPGAVNIGDLGRIRAAGVNRIVFGAQSFSDEDLGFLGRIHSASDAVRCCAEARDAGFGNVGLDLIYGLPGRSQDHWREQMRSAAGLGPDHISCYSLTIEKGTPLWRDAAAGLVRMPDEEEARAMFLLTLDRMRSLGYGFYEISNFARSPESRCRHNLGYWSEMPYLGFGPSAHSFDGRRRSWNDPDLEGYVGRIESGRPPAGGGEDLTKAQIASEMQMLGLRTSEGADLGGIERDLCPGFIERTRGKAGELVSGGLAVMEGGRLRLTPGGLAVADAIAAALAP